MPPTTTSTKAEKPVLKPSSPTLPIEIVLQILGHVLRSCSTGLEKQTARFRFGQVSVVFYCASIADTHTFVANGIQRVAALGSFLGEEACGNYPIERLCAVIYSPTKEEPSKEEREKHVNEASHALQKLLANCDGLLELELILRIDIAVEVLRKSRYCLVDLKTLQLGYQTGVRAGMKRMSCKGFIEALNGLSSLKVLRLQTHIVWDHDQDAFTTYPLPALQGLQFDRTGVHGEIPHLLLPAFLQSSRSSIDSLDLGLQTITHEISGLLESVAPNLLHFRTTKKPYPSHDHFSHLFRTISLAKKLETYLGVVIEPRNGTSQASDFLQSLRLIPTLTKVTLGQFNVRDAQNLLENGCEGFLERAPPLGLKLMLFRPPSLTWQEELEGLHAVARAKGVKLELVLWDWNVDWTQYR